MFEKLVQSRARIFKLPRSDISGRHFAPDLVQRVGRISRDYLFEAVNSVPISLLLPRNASKLVTGIDLFGIDLQGALKSFPRLVQLAPALMDQSQIVVRRSISRIQRCRLEILLESRLRAMTTQDVANVPTHEHKQQKQQER